MSQKESLPVWQPVLIRLPTKPPTVDEALLPETAPVEYESRTNSELHNDPPMSPPTPSALLAVTATVEKELRTRPAEYPTSPPMPALELVTPADTVMDPVALDVWMSELEACFPTSPPTEVLFAVPFEVIVASTEESEIVKDAEFRFPTRPPIFKLLEVNVPPVT